MNHPASTGAGYMNLAPVRTRSGKGGGGGKAHQQKDRTADRHQIMRWSEAILGLSFDLVGGEASASAFNDFVTVTSEMSSYVGALIDERKALPKDDLLTRLVGAEVDGEYLTHEEILGFFQLLLVAGQETTTNLINNAVLCFIEHPAQLARLMAAPDLLPAAIEEVLRYRSPFQWTVRATKYEVSMNGQVLPAGNRVLPMMGAANRDPAQFEDPDTFDIGRDPNPHIAFGQGIHFCLGAPLARLESRVALTELLNRLSSLTLAEKTPWTPRRALHVHGPERLPVRFEPASPRTAY